MDDIKQGLMVVGLPNETYELVRAVAKKRGLSVNKAFSQALIDFARKHLSTDELAAYLQYQSIDQMARDEHGSE